MRPWDVLAGVALAVSLVGCACGVDAPRGDLIASASVTPDSLPFSGGPIHISVEVLPGLPVSLTATVVFPSGDDESTAIARRGEKPNEWEGVFDIPANKGDNSVEYTVKVVAIGATESVRDERIAGVVRVAGLERPPPAPLSEGLGE